jgi:hypothetical protein
MKMLEFNRVISTDGKTSLWSRREAEVRCTELTVPYVSDNRDFGELRVYFDTKSWNVRKDGLIYTDKRFLEELCVFLSKLGLKGEVCYSEQGMQGDDYVSCDVDGEFIRNFQKRINSHQHADNLGESHD